MSNFAFSCIDWHFLKITVLTFFIISLVIFGLQRRTLSQTKALEILFWLCFIIFSPRINICWAIMSRSCTILWTFFFTHPLLASFSCILGQNKDLIGNEHITVGKLPVFSSDNQVLISMTRFFFFDVWIQIFLSCLSK